MLARVNLKNEHMINASRSPAPNVNANEQGKEPDQETWSIQFNCRYDFVWRCV